MKSSLHHQFSIIIAKSSPAAENPSYLIRSGNMGRLVNGQVTTTPCGIICIPPITLVEKDSKYKRYKSGTGYSFIYVVRLFLALAWHRWHVHRSTRMQGQCAIIGTHSTVQIICAAPLNSFTSFALKTARTVCGCGRKADRLEEQQPGNLGSTTGALCCEGLPGLPGLTLGQFTT